MTQLDLGKAHSGTRERLSPKAIEKLLAVTIVTLQTAWLSLLAYGTKWLIFG